MGIDRTVLTQIGEHIAAVIVIPHAGPIERLKLGSSKGRRSNRQGHWLVQALETGQTDSSLFGLVGVLIAISTTAFHAVPEGRIFAAMRYEVTDNYFTLICHEYCAPL